MPQPTRVIVVANRTAATPQLIDAVRGRAARGGAVFHLVVPPQPHGLHRVVDPSEDGRAEAQAVLDEALPLLRAAAGAEVTGEVGDAEPLSAIQDVINLRGADEIIISTLPRRVSRWMRLDLVSKARGLGLPVHHVEAAESGVPDREPAATS
jgi:nucleotide-binding universal stress UspA family protein